jgi:hypothetical protein
MAIAESEALSSPVPSHPDSDSRIAFNIWAIRSDSNCPAAFAAFKSFTPLAPSADAPIPTVPTLIF